MDTSIARRSDGKLIRAEQGIDKSLPFNCPGCKQEVYAATEGKVQRPHFRHKSIDDSKGCSEPESYIHWITKELFADFFKKTESFVIDIPYYLTCNTSGSCRKKEVHKLDLKKRFPNILVEAYDQGFKPDCMLFNDSGENLYLEVKYTHEVSREKIDLGVPIIEIAISSEKDIDEIIKKGKIESGAIKIYNENSLLPNKSTFDCGGKCLRKPVRIFKKDPIAFEKKMLNFWDAKYGIVNIPETGYMLMYPTSLKSSVEYKLVKVSYNGEKFCIYIDNKVAQVYQVKNGNLELSHDKYQIKDGNYDFESIIVDHINKRGLF